MDKKVLTATEAARVLNVSKPILYRLCKTPGFPAIYVGRAVRIPYDGLVRWMEENSGNRVL